jgi:hypothetical protein
MSTSSRVRRRAQRSFALGSAGLLIAAVIPLGGASAAPSNFLELDGNEISNGAIDWANSGDLTTTNNVYSRSGSGGLFDGGVFINNTTPPTAPTRTANGTDIPAASFKVDPLSSDVTACGTGDPTAYTGQGSEVNGGLLTSDTFSTSSIPNKDDLSNVFAAAHVNATTNEVFFGGERVINNGDSHIDYEFLQSDVSIPDACSGSFSGNRTQGDFLLSIDFTSGGTLGGTHLYKWICDKTFNAAHDGNVCNPPANGKSVPHYVEGGNDAVNLTVNAGTTPIGCGGWVCRNADGSPTQTLAQNELMEGGIDLNAIGFTGCISTFLPHTRSSQSFTATLKDFEVIPFNTCAHPTITTAIANASGTPLTLDSNGVAHATLGTVLRDTATLHGAAGTPTGSVTYKLYDNNTCAGTTVLADDGLVADLTPSPNALVNGVPPFSNTFTFNDAGSYWFVASAAFTDNRNLGTPSSGCTAEPLVVAPATPAPHSTPVVQIKDTLRVTGFSSNATGNVVVGLYTNSTCTTRAAGTSDTSFTVAQASAAAGVETSFVTVTAGTYYYKLFYAGDNNNTGFNDCTENVGVTITSKA